MLYKHHCLKIGIPHFNLQPIRRQLGTVCDTGTLNTGLPPRPRPSGYVTTGQTIVSRAVDNGYSEYDWYKEIAVNSVSPIRTTTQTPFSPIHPPPHPMFLVAAGLDGLGNPIRPYGSKSSGFEPETASEFPKWPESFICSFPQAGVVFFSNIYVCLCYALL